MTYSRDCDCGLYSTWSTCPFLPGVVKDDTLNFFKSRAAGVAQGALLTSSSASAEADGRAAIYLLGETYFNAARLDDVSEATVDRYVAFDRERGIDGLKQFDWTWMPSELVPHQTSLEELFRLDPPHTTAEAC